MRSIALCLLVMVAGPAAAEIRWQPRAVLELGVDSFAQVYRLTDIASESLLSDESTLRTETDVFTELRAAAELGLRVGDPRNGTDVRTRLSYGTDTVRGDATASVDLRGERNRLDATFEAEGRRFRDDSDYTLSSDYGELRARSHWRVAVRDAWDLGLRVRGELTRYDRASAFELDNERLDVSVTSELRGDLGQWFDLEIGAGRRRADTFEDPDAGPDDTAIVSVLSYDRYFALAEWAYDAGERWRVGLSHWIERRDYDDEDQRSSLWDLVVEPEIRMRLDDRWALRWRTGIEWLDYDRDSDTYYDLALGRTGLAVLRQWRTFEWSVEPRISWISTPVPNEDEYVQPSVAFGFDGFGGDRFFVSVTEEIGHRDYRDPVGDLALYSDYWFLRSTILASVTLVEGTSLEFFLSDEPESHRSEEDDARLTLVTGTLRVRF